MINPKKKVLIVDDEEDILELVQFHLEREGYDILCAETGEDAVKKVCETSPDLIVLDSMLPGIDGLEVARRLKIEHQTNSQRVEW